MSTSIDNSDSHRQLSTLPSPRGERSVNPLIREHVRNVAQNPQLALAFMTDNQNAESKTSITLMSKPSNATISISQTNADALDKPAKRALKVKMRKGYG